MDRRMPISVRGVMTLATDLFWKYLMAFRGKLQIPERTEMSQRRSSGMCKQRLRESPHGVSPSGSVSSHCELRVTPLKIKKL